MVMGECISASKCWSLLRGGLSQEGSLNRGTTVYIQWNPSIVATIRD